ncbi:MAG: DUF2147 domain-containing protein [Candidatus Marinimicrobia bacterium]|nr:DUF2147 domain-containing protein [Candidatus Neomarinimicrobiota bacterium]
MKNLVSVFLTLLMFASMSPAQTGDLIIGKYQLPNNLEIEIFKSDGKYFGKIIGLSGFNEGQEQDIHNPDKSNQNDLLMGKTIIKDLEYDNTKHQWVDGSMYGPGKGLIFNLKIAKVRQDEIEVVASKFLFWKTLNWVRM